MRYRWPWRFGKSPLVLLPTRTTYQNNRYNESP